MTTVNREVRLKRRPEGMPQESDFELVETPVPEPGEGEILVRNIYMSVDPYMRGRMREVRSYARPFEVGEVMHGANVGQVIESRHDAIATGDFVVGMQAWRELYTSDGSDQRKVDASLAPISAYLGVLGGPGLTAYVGLFDIGKAEAGESLFVSGAAGAVGSLVGQLGKIKGMRVAGSAGSQRKVDYLLGELGFDAAFNYKDGDLHEALSKACPDGIDVYFENVGGEMLEAVLLHMRPFGRIPVCGMISQYNNTAPEPGPRTIISLIPNRLTMRGFIVSDHLDRLPEFTREVSAWLREGKIKASETKVQGIENAVHAFLGLFAGENLGKMLVQLAEDPTI